MILELEPVLVAEIHGTDLSLCILLALINAKNISFNGLVPPLDSIRLVRNEWREEGKLYPYDCHGNPMGIWKLPLTEIPGVKP